MKYLKLIGNFLQIIFKKWIKKFVENLFQIASKIMIEVNKFYWKSVKFI